jgi:hypothetical protein
MDPYAEKLERRNGFGREVFITRKMEARLVRGSLSGSWQQLKTEDANKRELTCV